MPYVFRLYATAGRAGGVIVPYASHPVKHFLKFVEKISKKKQLASPQRFWPNSRQTSAYGRATVCLPHQHELNENTVKASKTFGIAVTFISVCSKKSGLNFGWLTH